MAARLAAWTAALIPSQYRSLTSDLLNRAFLVAKTFCFVSVVNNHVVSLTHVRGPSMLPAFNLTGDVVLMDHVTPRWGSVGVGSVVVFRSPENPRRIVTKRVVGVEGDEVRFVRGPESGTEAETVVVPKGHVWVQGDNINLSKDSRVYGPVPCGLIQGRAFMRVWPLEDFGFIEENV